MRSLFILLFFLPFFNNSHAQQFDSRKSIKRGIQLYDNSQYDAAAKEFLKVPLTDTNYLLAQYELALSYSADSTTYQKALDVINESKKVPFNKYELSLKMLEGSVYDKIGTSAAAHKTYDEILLKHPEYPQVYYEKAIVYFLSEDYENAVTFLKKSLTRNPYHFRSHYYLGKCYYLQGRIAEAMIATNFAMMSTSNKGQAGIAGQQLYFLSKGSDTLINRSKKMNPKYKDAAFDEMTEVLLSRVAMDKKYQLKTELDDPITRQLQVIYEMAEYQTSNDRFVNQYYIPFIQQVWKTDRYNEFVLYILADLGSKTIDKKIKRNKKGVGKVKEEILAYFSKISSTRELNFQRRNSMNNKYLASAQDLIVASNELKQIGKEEKYLYKGPFKYYNKGMLRSEGNYDQNNKKVGLWKYYNSLGLLVEEENYTNGELVGWEKVFSAYGVLTSEMFYDSESRVTKMKEYENGLLNLEVVETMKGEPVDVTLYHSNGKVRCKYKVKDKKKTDGVISYYYDNGQLASKVNYKNNKTEGVVNAYSKNGKKSSIENYKNDKLSGLCKYYFDNGNIRYEYTYIDNELNGPFKQYFLNGNIEIEGSYKAGKFNGEIKNYYYDGRLLSTIQYKKGLVIGSKYEDAKNARYNNTPKTKERFFFADGNLASDLKNNSKGALDGLNSYFYYSGSKKQTLHYKDGTKEGVTKRFYSNGKKQAIGNYKNDLLNGFYTTFDVSGDSSSIAYYVDDKIEGSRKGYAQGVITSNTQYIKGKLDGPAFYYNLQDRTLYKSKWYKNSLLVGVMEYDKKGAVTNFSNFPGGNGTYITHHLNGAEDYKVSLRNGQFHGKGVKKFFDGKLHEREEYENGELIGEKEVLYYNGSKSDYYRYNKLGAIQLYEDYGINGFKNRVITYSDTPNYYVTEYFIGNQPSRIFVTQEDEVNGQEIYYGSKKEVGGIMNYHMGKTLSYTYLDKSGNYVKPISLNGGKGHVIMYYQNGQKSVEFTLKNGYSEGQYTHYYQNGKVAKLVNYKDQMIIGDSKEFAENGQLLNSISYNEKGALDGVCEFYNASGQLYYKVKYKNGLIIGDVEMLDSKTGKMMKLTYDNNTIVHAK